MFKASHGQESGNLVQMQASRVAVASHVQRGAGVPAVGSQFLGNPFAHLRLPNCSDYQAFYWAKKSIMPQVELFGVCCEEHQNQQVSDGFSIEFLTCLKTSTKIHSLIESAAGSHQNFEGNEN